MRCPQCAGLGSYRREVDIAGLPHICETCGGNGEVDKSTTRPAHPLAGRVIPALAALARRPSFLGTWALGFTSLGRSGVKDTFRSNSCDFKNGHLLVQLPSETSLLD